MKEIEWIAAFALSFSVFNTFADDCGSRLNTCDTRKKELPSCRDEKPSPDHATLKAQDKDGCISCVKPCVPRKANSSGTPRGFQEQFSKTASLENEKRLIIGQNSDLAIQIANINPDAAYALHTLGHFSKKVDHLLPAKSEIRQRRFRTTAEVIEIIMGRHQQKAGSNDPSLKGLAQINQLPYELVEHADGQAFLVLGQRTVDQQGRVIGQKWPDVRVRLQWTPVGEAGYWQPVALENP